MKIARIRHLFFPNLPKDYFYELSGWQVRIGHKVDVIAWSCSNTPDIKVVSEGFSIHSLKGVNLAIPHMFENYPFLPGLNYELERLKPDIVHAESHLFLPSAQAILKAKKMGIPSVVSVHGVFASRDFSTNLFQKTYIRTIGLEIFKKADLIVCLTDSDLRELVEFGVRDSKIRVVSNAVDSDLFLPGVARDASLVIWVGRFVYEKGVEYLLQAAKIVLAKKKDVIFLLIGYGPLKTKMQRLAVDLGLPKDSVVFAKGMDRQSIAKVLAQSAVFVFPSIKEGMPLALLEAMSAGNAVVASNIPGVADVIVDKYNGLLVEPKNPQAIAFSVLELLDNPCSRIAFSKNARLTIEEKFSKEKMLSKLDAVYEEARGKHN